MLRASQISLRKEGSGTVTASTLRVNGRQTWYHWPYATTSRVPGGTRLRAQAGPPDGAGVAQRAAHRSGGAGQGGRGRPRAGREAAQRGRADRSARGGLFREGLAGS